MNIKLKQAFDAQMEIAIGQYRQGEFSQAFKHLEIAHVLGQRYVIPHVRSHWWMLKLGVRKRSAKEVAGQVARIVLGALGSLIGVIPIGNTGGTNIDMFKRLPIDNAVMDLLER